MKFHVHLGVHKTATTFLQSELHENRRRLNEGGVGHAGIWAVRKRFTRTFERLAWTGPAARLMIRKTLASSLDALVDESNARDVFILSDENLSGLLSVNYWSGRLYPQISQRVGMLDELIGRDRAHYFLSIRRYPDFLTSSWLQLAVKGRAPDFERYRSKFSPDRPGWGEMVARIVRASGPERLTVWTYDWFRDDPARVFALIAPGATLDIPESGLRRDVLPSLTTKGLKVMSALEPVLSRDEYLRMAKLVRNFEFEGPNPRLEIEDPVLCQAYEDKYRRDLETIAALGVDLRA